MTDYRFIISPCPGQIVFPFESWSIFFTDSLACNLSPLGNFVTTLMLGI